jgi:hypothetical protein
VAIFIGLAVTQGFDDHTLRGLVFTHPIDEALRMKPSLVQLVGPEANTPAR